ncbi:MAG: calcium-binding EGF-like domain-containing protein [Chitinophagaceae bacterium]|nr:calcium-binding EGF-like domain-containing protein [Chitinophagaceae bacterium]
MKIKCLNLRDWLLVVALPLVIASCQKENADPCDKTVCLNGGHCANGNCVCPEGYGGADCSQPITPKKIKITKIEVTRFPATDNNGAGWDPTSGPDIYLKLSKGDVQIWKSANTYNYQNADPSKIYSFDITPAVDLTDPQDQYTITLYDYDDFDADDFMGGIIFTPYTKSNRFPSVLALDAGGTVAFKLYVSYTW